MQKFSTWMIVSLDVIFWMLRIVATYTYTMGIDFMIKPLDTNVEIALIFFTLLAFILIVKRKLLGPVIYISVLMSFIGIILPTLTMFDWLLDKNKKLHPTDKKTDWFYRNKKYDIQKDDRADKNNYRTL